MALSKESLGADGLSGRAAGEKALYSENSEQVKDRKRTRNVLKMAKKTLNVEKTRFVNDMTSLLMPLGMPQIMARIYGYLLLSEGPISLDQIVADLEVSKSSVSVAARQLEIHALIRRHGERGSKRILYEASDTYAGVLSQQGALLASLGKLLNDRGSSVAAGTTLKRLKGLAAFYISMCEAMQSVQARELQRMGSRKS